MVYFKHIAILCLVSSSSITFGSDNLAACKNVFLDQISPKIISNKLNQNVYYFCYKDFAVGYSGVSKTGLWSAEYVTPSSIKAAQAFPRVDNFQEEMRVPEIHRAKLTDYRGSGMDRGHLSPSAQRSSREAQSDSFLLTNLSPQNSTLNQGLWAEIEKSTRGYIKKSNQPAYIITGPLFLGPKLKMIGNNMLVPTHLFKVIYYPNLNVVGAYIAVNDNSGRVDSVSLNQLQQHSGIAFFPRRLNNPLFNYRFELPMTPYQTSQTKLIGKSPVNTSQIFTMLPSNSLTNNQVQKPRYKQNRDEASEIGKGLATEMKDVGINMLRKLLH